MPLKKIIKPEDFGLGRRPHYPDSRDEKFLLRSLIPKSALKAVQKKSKYWYANGWWGDQGEFPHCVGFAWTHWLEDGPITQPGKIPIVDPAGLYNLAQRVDEWPGENYAGTSVRAGAKVLEKLGFVGSYYWAWDVQTLADAVHTLGPVVVGTNWYEGMFFPTDKNYLEIKGRVAGGHAYLINGIDPNKEEFRIKNSWGRSWGSNGHVRIKFADMERLILEDGEVCIATEIKRTA